MLGIDFDGNLSKMDRNLDRKIAEIRKVFNCWINRSLTVYGKIVVVKTLALSKLSDVALVIPCINQNKINEIESLIFRFIWNNKPDKFSRNHTKLPEAKSWLGVIDIKDFCQAFRFSWVRRLLKTGAFWPKILLDTVSKISGENVSKTFVFEMGHTKFLAIGKKMQNKFWKEVFSSIAPTVQGALFCHPEIFFLTSFWKNTFVTKNRLIKSADFPDISAKITYFQDLFKIGSNKMLSKAEIEENCNILLSH